MNWKKNAIFLLSIVVCSIPLFLTFNKGINYFDEGYIIEGARRILTGEVPYRDFHFIYTPGVIYLLAFSLRFFGQYIIVERIAAMVVSIIGVIFLGLLIRRQTKNNLLMFLSMVSYTLWGPTHINFLWPIMVVLPLIFIYLFLLLESHFFLAGSVAALVLLCKHNLGGALVISLLCYFVCVKRSRRQILMICTGFMSVITLFILHLLATRSFFPFLADMNTYTIQEILVKKSFSVPFPTQPIGKFLLYIFPGVVSFILSGLILHKKNKKLLIIPLTIFTLYLFGIFPTPDWTHLTPFISLMGILFALIFHIVRNKCQPLIYLLMMMSISAGIYSVLMRNYYRWEAPLIQHTHCFSSGRMKYMCIDEKNYAIITQTVLPIQKQTTKNGYIFAFYNNPLYYFLTQRDNPTPFIDFNVVIGKEAELKVIHSLLQKKVVIIITRFPPQNNQSTIINNYIKENYTPLSSVYEFTIWKYRKQ